MSTITELPAEERLNNVKENLLRVRELVVRADSIVDGDQYAIVGGSILTAAFAFVWYWDPSFLTFIAFLGFVATIADYCGPKLLGYMFNTNDWNEDKEKKYHGACENVVRIFNNLENVVVSYKDYRSQKPLLNFGLTVVILVALAWIGNRINNFFLAYLLTITTLLLPKLLRQGVLQNGMSMLKPLLDQAYVTISVQMEKLTTKYTKKFKEQYTMLKTE